jgi:glycine cleavage system H protein
VSAVPDELRYTKEHEWARLEGERVVVGITDYAQDQLGDVVYVSLPEPGAPVRAGEACGEVESTKSVSDIYSPVSGTVAASNESLVENPGVVNQDPYGDGWLFEVADLQSPVDGLLDASEYRAHIQEDG